MKHLERISVWSVILLLVAGFFFVANPNVKKIDASFGGASVVLEKYPKEEMKVAAVLPTTVITDVSCNDIGRDCYRNTIPVGQKRNPLIGGNVFMGISCTNVGKSCINSATDDVKIYGLTAEKVGQDAIHLGKDD